MLMGGDNQAILGINLVGWLHYTSENFRFAHF